MGLWSSFAKLVRLKKGVEDEMKMVPQNQNSSSQIGLADTISVSVQTLPPEIEDPNSQLHEREMPSNQQSRNPPSVGKTSRGRTRYEAFVARMDKRNQTGPRPKPRIYEAWRGKLAEVRGFTRTKAKALYYKRRALLIRDEYGKSDTSAWFAEVDRFVTRVLPIKLRPKSKNEYRETKKVVFSVVNGFRPPEEFKEATDPIDFELSCAHLFKRAGWSATTTKRSNDQGIDVFAEKGEQSLVIQCKFHDRPVGNKAVQEAFSGARFRHAVHAIVVSKTGFTRSAKQLASSLGVHLVQFHQLQDLEKILRKTR